METFWNISGAKCHIHYIDDECVVYKWWRKHKQRWEWEAEARWLFDYCIEREMYKTKRPST